MSMILALYVYKFTVESMFTLYVLDYINRILLLFDFYVDFKDISLPF